MYARESEPVERHEADYDEVDARTIEWLKEAAARRAEARSAQQSSRKSLHPELIGR